MSTTNLRAQTPHLAATNVTFTNSEKEGSRRHSELASLIASALQAPGHPHPNETPTFPGTTIATNTAYPPVGEAITASENLLKEYARLDDMIKGMRKEQMQPLGETWNQDIEEADGKLRMGARVALRRVGKVLGIDKMEEDGDEIMGEEDGVVVTSREEVEMGEKSYELQKSLRYAERGVRRMVKGLKEEEYEAGLWRA